MKSKFLVPFETAQLLKEKGYNSLCDCYYEPDKELYLGILVSNMDYEDCGNCSAPTYHEVVDWLEGKGLCITCGEPLVKQFASQYTATVLNNNTNEWCMCGIYPTREETLNVGILKALEML